MRSFANHRKCLSLALYKDHRYIKQCAILAVLMCGIVPFHTALALSCGRKPTLQESYDSSKYIVIAQLAVCTNTSRASSGYYQECELEIDEVLKGKYPPRKLRALTKYNLPQTGDIRLLFSSLDEQFIADTECGGRGGVLRREGAEDLQNNVDRLRKYRDGVIADLSEPWRFLNNNRRCAIFGSFKGGSINLGYSLSRSARERVTPGLVITNEGVKFEPQSPRLSVNFYPGSFRWTPRDVSIKIARQEWPLGNPALGWSILSPDNMKVTRDTMSHIIQGAVVMEVLNAMTPPAAIIVRGNHPAVGSRAKSSEPTYVHFEAKTTHINPAAQQFRECMAFGTIDLATDANTMDLNL